MECSGCGSTTDSSQRFCHRCGASLDRVYAAAHEDATMEMSHDALQQAIAERAAQAQTSAVEGLAKAIESVIAEYVEQHPKTEGQHTAAALKLVLDRRIKD